MTNHIPSISVVIPTSGRPHLVKRAVQSALAQTFEATEVIVVVDGRDEATVEVLKRVDDARLRIKVLPRNVGSGGARNVGVEEA